MKDILIAPTIIPILAQVAPVQSEWERLGITGLSIAATVIIWRYFSDRQEAREKAEKESREKIESDNAKERDRLLREGNDRTQEVIELLKAQLANSQASYTGERKVHTILDNSARQPVPVKPVLPSGE